MHLLKFVNKVVSEHSEKEAVDKIRSVLYKDYIKTVVEAGDDDGFRMIFIGNRMKGNFNNPVTVECNGAVLYYSRAENKFSALAVPPHLFNSCKMTSKMIETKYKSGSYKCYPVLDGTIANLYFYKGQWRISTSKAYDATELQMLHGKTYRDVFFESGGTFDGLEPEYCYSVCIKNDNFHVFEKGSKVTFVQKVNMADLSKTSMQEEVHIRWSQLKHQLNHAVETYKSRRQTFFGVILRSENESILLESNLMIKIRNFLYNFSFANKLTQDCDLSFAGMLNVFINRRDVSLYLTLFPFYKKEFNRLNKLVEAAAVDLCDNKISSGLLAKAKKDVDEKKIELTKGEGLKIAYDFIRNPAYLNEFYDLASRS